MANTYNPYSEIKSVYDAKIGYANAKTDEERKKYQDAANKARQTLINYGRQDIADQISASGADANATKKIMDNWSTYGKTKVRDYMYSLGQKYGMSSSDVDKLISWDNNTKEISFGGKKIGTPETIVDGVSYTSDTSIYDNAFEDYVNRTGTTRSKETAVNQENEGLFKKYNQEYEDLKKTNPFMTDEAKAIMGKYDLAGLQARDNAVASGGASNGGNIDSYASANAMRQQAGLISQGQSAVLDAHQQKIDNIRGILSDMGVNIDRVFNQDETAKNNKVARLSEEAAVKGTVPTEWSYKDNIYLNDDGTVRDEYLTDDFDATGGFTTIINNAQAKLATTTDATERAKLNATIKSATQAKALKTFSNPKYAKYAHEVEEVAPEPTSNHYLENKAIDAGLEATKNTNDTNYALGNLEANTTKYVTDANNVAALKNTQMQIDATLKEAQNTGDYSGVVANMRSHFATNEKLGVQAFISDILLPSISGGNQVDKSDLAVLLKQNATNYGITKDDAKVIGFYFGISYDDDEWLKGYTFPETNAYNKKVVEGVDDKY